jgi:hypothetical protein
MSDWSSNLKGLVSEEDTDRRDMKQSLLSGNDDYSRVRVRTKILNPTHFHVKSQ